MSGLFLCKWWEPISASVSEFERNNYDGLIKDGLIQHGLIQDGCHHQVKWEWMSLSQIEIVWVSIRVEWECFWVNLKEDNKVSESKIAVSESTMAEFKMSAIIKLSQNEWVNFFVQNGWIQHGRILDGCHHQVESEWMREDFLCKWWKPILASGSDFQRTYYDGGIQDGQIQDSRIQDFYHHQVNENEWVWVRLN